MSSLWMVLLWLALPSPAPVTSPETEAVVATSEGTFVIRLLPDLAPLHVKHFLETARTKGYDKTTFHRVIAGGIVQGGDPLSKDPAKVALYGTGGLGLLKAEFSDRPFRRGTVAAARRPSSVDSGGSQFFVCLSEQAALKGQYTIFGEVIEGLDVLDAMSTTPADKDRPRKRMEIQSITLRTPAP